MKKIDDFYRWLLGIGILLLVVVNFQQVWSFIDIAQGNIYFTAKSYNEASDTYAQSDSDVWMYNNANSLYKQGKFDEAMTRYQLITTWRNQVLDRYVFHNQGNSLYRQGQIDAVNRTNLWEQAILSYQSSLAIHEDKDTRFNLEFVKKQLDILKKQEKQQSNQQQQNGQQNQQGQQNNSGSVSSPTGINQQWTGNTPWTGSSENTKPSNQTSSSGGSWSHSDSQKMGTSWSGAQSTTGNHQGMTTGSNASQWLSQDQKQALQNYKNQLSQQQVQYGQYYNKVYQDQSNDPIQNFFNGNTFFDNSLLNQWSDKKDW